MGELKEKVACGLVWAALEKLSLKVVTFGVTLVLARLLSPSDYGTVALLYIFTGIAGTLVDVGLGKALVQKKDAQAIHFNSVFYLSLLLAGVLYTLLFFGAPFVAAFYKQPVLTDLLRVMSVSLFFHAVNGVQGAELTRNLRFKDGMKVSVLSALASAVVGITLACLGYGPWALVWSQVAAGVGSTVAYWHFIAWRPQLMFNWVAVQGLFSFGWKMALSGILDTVYSELSGLVIGKLYTKEDLAFVNRGKGLPAVGMETINGTLLKVSFPALAKLQDDRLRLREAMRQMIQISTFVVFPTMMGCAVCAESLVRLLYGDQWLCAVPYARIYCFAFALWPFHTINLQAIIALGRSDMFLKLEIIKKVVGLALMVVSMRYGVLAFVLTSCLVGNPMSLLINSWPNRRLLNYTVGMQLRDVWPSLVASFAMGAVVWGVGCLGTSLHAGRWLLGVQIVVGMGAYALICWGFRVSVMGRYLRMLTAVMPSRLEFFNRLARHFE